MCAPKRATPCALQAAARVLIPLALSAPQILFHAGGITPGTDRFDQITVSSDGGDVQIPLRALAPRPLLRLLPDPAGEKAPAAAADGGAPASSAAALLEFGVVPANSCQARRLLLVNEGSRPASWKASVDG